MTSWKEKWDSLVGQHRPDSNFRKELESDRLGVRAVNEAAFETTAEAHLVDLLRDQASPYIALVEEKDGLIRGHIVFTPVTHEERPDLKILGLGPMAVLPEFQRGRIGTVLVLEGLDRCTANGFGAVILVGHPAYYQRFGFVPASRFGLKCQYDVPDDVFMAIELEEGYLSNAAGLVKYHPAFSEV